MAKLSRGSRLKRQFWHARIFCDYELRAPGKRFVSEVNTVKQRVVWCDWRVRLGSDAQKIFASNSTVTVTPKISTAFDKRHFRSFQFIQSGTNTTNLTMIMKLSLLTIFAASVSAEIYFQEKFNDEVSMKWFGGKRCLDSREDSWVIGLYVFLSRRLLKKSHTLSHAMFPLSFHFVSTTTHNNN